MGVIYQIFGVGLAGVVAVGAFLALLGNMADPWPTRTRPLTDHIGSLVTILASLSGAGLLSVAFIIDNLVATEVNIAVFVGDSTAENALMAVMWLLAFGGSGLLAALALMLSGTAPPGAEPGAVAAWLRRWTAACVAVSAIAVVLLFPAVIALVLSTHDALLLTAP